MAINIAAQDDACKGIVSIAAQAFVEERTTEGILNAQEFFSDPANYARLEKWHKGNTQWVLETWVKVWTSPAFSKWSLEDVIIGEKLFAKDYMTKASNFFLVSS